MKHCTWKAFRDRRGLRGLWLDLAEPSGMAPELRLRGKITWVRWGRTILTMRVSFFRAMTAGHWRIFGTPLNRYVVFDLSLSRGGIRVLDEGCFRWASADGRVCTTARTPRKFSQLPPRRSPQALARQISRRLLQANADH